MSPKIIKNQEPGTETFKFRDYSELDEAMVFANPNFQDAQPISEPLDVMEDSLSTEMDIQKVIQKAKFDADQILKKAREEAAQIEKTAYERGLGEGQKSGQLIAQQQMQPLMARFQETINQLTQAREQAIHQLQTDMVDLIIHSAEKMVKQQISLHPSTIMAIIRDAIHELSHKENLTVYLNPEDYQFLIQAKEGLQKEQQRLEEDPQLSRGSVRIQTERGELDGTLETKLNHLKTALNQAQQEQ